MKKITIPFILITLLMLSTFFSVSFAKPANTTYGTYNGMEYTQTTGKLGKGDYVIYMPESWNGRFVIGCTGYNYFQDPHPEFLFDPHAKWLVSEGYAFAASNYIGGERAYAVKEGIIRTHQLTQYVVDKYDVTDKIFLFGISMGGQIALNLAHKYPDLYSGVLDVCGAKDAYGHYAYSQLWTTKTVAELRVIFGFPESVDDSVIAGLKIFFATVLADTIEEYGGTIEEKPQAYERYDPVYHADLQVPTISLVGGIDLLVPLSCHLTYQAAVTACGCSDLYELDIVPTGGHADIPIQTKIPAKLLELIAWSDSLD